MKRDIRLLVRADDAGSSWSSNVGCLRACTQGIATSVEVMMPCAWTPHAAALFNPHPQIDIGIHLTLTSEWEATKWRPITHAPSLTDQYGFFLPLLNPREMDKRPSLASANWCLDEIEAELRAQITSGLRMFRNVSHVSTHMLKHLNDFDPEVGDLVTRLCREYTLADDAFGHGLPRFVGYPALPRNTASRVTSFTERLQDLKNGTYIFIDHPAVPSDELSTLGHSGYDDVAADRTSCLDVLTHKTVQDTLHDLGVQLISYRDL